MVWNSVAPLETLTKASKGVQADERRPQTEEGFVDISPSFVAHRQPTEAVQPGQRALSHPPIPPQPLLRLDAFARQAREDVAAAARRAVGRRVVGFLRLLFV